VINETKSAPIVIRLRPSQELKLDEVYKKWGYRNRTALLGALTEFALTLDTLGLAIDQRKLDDFKEKMKPWESFEKAAEAFEALHGALEFVVRAVLSEQGGKEELKKRD
jgi:hypothetical protein